MGPDLRALSEAATRLVSSPIVAIKAQRWCDAVLTGRYDALESIATKLGIGAQFRRDKPRSAPATLSRLYLNQRMLGLFDDLVHGPTVAKAPAPPSSGVDISDIDFAEAYRNHSDAMKAAGH